MGVPIFLALRADQTQPAFLLSPLGSKDHSCLLCLAFCLSLIAPHLSSTVTVSTRFPCPSLAPCPSLSFHPSSFISLPLSLRVPCHSQIPRYILTLHELLAHTPHEHVERNSLDYAKSKLEELSR